MKLKSLRISLMIGSMSLLAYPVSAQQAAEPAPNGQNIPPVDVVQKPKAPVAAKKAPAKKKAVAKAAPVEPEPQAPSAADFQPADAIPATANASEYPPGGQGAAARAAAGASSPISPTRGIAPADLSTFAGSVSRASRADINAQQPQDNHELLARIPGVNTVSDDGMARHSGIAVRGSPHRRSRKVLVMEDGVPINFSTYLDSSTHYTPPTQRIESVEVLRGPVVSYGPLNNHGIVNFRNLNPFGANETVIEGALGHTSGSDKNLNNYRHTHTRQNLGNVGVVASYSGGDAGGAWDVEELRYNDFYGALGFKGSNQDLTISGGFFRQRDTYDEDNFGGSTADFFANRRNKKQGAADGNFASELGYEWSNYNADYYRLQVAHNLYLTPNTTISTRVFGNDHERARFYVEEDTDSATDFVMEGRDRRYRNYGADSRVEFANLPLFGGMKHDVQAGVRYEEHFFDNKNRVGEAGERLDFDNRGEFDGAIQRLEADSFAAFVQTAIHVTPTFTLTPGVRFESYDVSFNDPDEPDVNGSASYNHVLPMLAFSWEALPRTALYGGYHRGLTPHIIRDLLEADTGAFIAPDEEVGDNFELGVRSTAVRGLTLDMAYFHKRIENYQFGEAFQSGGGDRVFTALDETEFKGFEIYSRLDSKAFTGSRWNVFGEAVYTHTDSEIISGSVNDDNDDLVDVAGNAVPESMRHVANLTLGIEYLKRWDASLTWTHRGAFFTDALNIGHVPDDTEVGVVDDVWLLSARTNVHVTDNLSLFVSGQNLTNEFYVSDRSDGAKPGVGRTVWGGFKYKF
ncbi:MAG: TonB-dependent receptor [Hyphomicrobiaceae bacterium]|nr:TonB-dependent receptor [Hyphomicrobiaceae bacterium]